MADLETKFEVLEAQLLEQHTAIGNKLDALLAAMGVPPPTATVTLADTVAVLNALNNNLIGIAIANGTYHAAVLTALSTFNASLAGMRLENAAFYETMSVLTNAINVNTDTLINNSSLNAQRLIAAILSTACACEIDRPLLAPPLDVTPTPLVDDAKCRRIQFYLSLFSTWLQSIASYGSSGATMTGEALDGLLVKAGKAVGMTATVAEGGAIFGLPGAIVGAIIGAIVAAAYALGGDYLVTQATLFASPLVQTEMLAALYAANNADEGANAFGSVVADNFDVIPSGILNFLWWSAWSNDLYADTPVVDDSAFDGTICGDPAEELDCVELTAELASGFWQIRFPTGVFRPGGDFIGSKIKVLSGGLVNFVWWDFTFHVIDITGYTSSYYEIDMHTESIQINVDASVGGSFSVEWCEQITV